MSDIDKDYWNKKFTQEEKDNKLSEDILNLLDTFNLLKIEEKIVVKRLIKNMDIFA